MVLWFRTAGCPRDGTMVQNNLMSQGWYYGSQQPDLPGIAVWFKTAWCPRDGTILQHSQRDGTKLKNSLMFQHFTIHFTTSSEVSERASKWAQCSCLYSCPFIHFFGYTMHAWKILHSVFFEGEKPCANSRELSRKRRRRGGRNRGGERRNQIQTNCEWHQRETE